MTPDAIKWEGSFAKAVLDADARVPAALVGRDGRRPMRRFTVYRNNVYAGLVNALAGRFPATLKLVGEEFFRAMARDYVEKTPPRSAVLIHYGGDFPDFIGAFPPASAVPYLADVARLEWAWHEAYHAADAEPLSQEALAALGTRAEDIGFIFHPSARLVRSTYPVITIWELTARHGENEPGRLPASGEEAFVVRPALQVTVRRLPAGGVIFAEALMAGEKLPDAAAVALTAEPEFDFAANLAGLMRSGALVGTR